jgi:NitT/TauT family transport system substrate-binding protein
MVKFFSSFTRVVCLITTLVMMVVAGCSSSGTTGAEAPNNSKKMPDQMTKVKVAYNALNIDTLPWHVAEKKGIFKKYNLEVEFSTVDGATTALRGLQSGDYHFLMSLPEPFIVGATEGSTVKLIGALVNQTMYNVYLTPDVQNIEELKGKNAAGLGSGSGTDFLIAWLLKKHGLQADKDVRILTAGGGSSRVQALKSNQAQLTLLSPPSDQAADAAGLKRIGALRDELKNYNHDPISANSKFLKEKPEVARAFIAATSEAIDFVKNESNRKEVTEIGTKALDIKEDSFSKSLDFALPAYADKAKLNHDGLKIAIDILKENGSLKKDITIEEFTDERYYAE